MPLLALIKTKPLLCSLAGAGTVAAPAAAICYATGAFSTPPKPTYSPPSFDTLSTDSKSSVIDQKYSGCFNGFFPGVKIGNRNRAGHNGNIADNTVDDGKMIGCALMKLDYTNSKTFAFSAEITVKNGAHGWAIKIYLKTDNTTQSGSNETYKFTYNIVFLTRDNSSKKWSVGGGIYLEPSSPGDPTANISFPNKTLIKDGNKDSTITESSKSWFATWEETSGNGDKEIFEDIRVDYDNHNKLYLGKPSDADCDCYPNTYVDPKKKYEAHKWNDNNGRISEICNKYKSQLKGKKGKWTWHDDPTNFCNELKSGEERDETKQKKLRSFCYSYVYRSFLADDRMGK